MNLGFHKPPDSLEPFVRRIIVSDYDLSSELVFHPWATGSIYLILFFGDLQNYSVSVNGRPRRFKSPLWMAGQLEYHQVTVAIRRRTSTVVVELQPQAFWRLFHRPGRWLTGRTCDPADADPGHADLGAQHFEALPHSAEDCLARMVAFLSEVAATAGPEDPTLAAALTAMHAEHGRISVGELAGQAGVTARHLTRRFHEIIGLAPKFYGRVLQINQVIEMMFLPRSGSLAGVASEGGYYDQAHLNRAMKLFFSKGPAAFLKSDHLLFRTFLEQHVEAG